MTWVLDFGARNMFTLFCIDIIVIVDSFAGVLWPSRQIVLDHDGDLVLYMTGRFGIAIVRRKLTYSTQFVPL